LRPAASAVESSAPAISLRSTAPAVEYASAVERAAPVSASPITATTRTTHAGAGTASAASTCDGHKDPLVVGVPAVVEAKGLLSALAGDADNAANDAGIATAALCNSDGPQLQCARRRCSSAALPLLRLARQ